ncbi:MAG: hypothetical protein A3A26_02075 [Candidatus Zambryskibacteria bacterium RIFCSPLOWO2_01_FULL_47_14]|uniref:Steroid 5-alpha reductase C-terminal domain-containing protein n=1 Tax=Candidatus Zambryskibacteria bacterium RIFCSPLOWO2_01_FULL_47_14 TaxID=1802763 RepID=A0A1G2U8L7_9BACT|nr:MAG: hypothetical protein A3A26_02075 [Candidatus Zambryskibacteria bacterium RIFCSPLOWO2_01_FULL_47_14]
MELHLPYKLLIATILCSLIVRYLTFGLEIPNKLALFTTLTLIIIGILIGLWVKRVIRNHKTTLNPYGKPTAIITSGPFQFSRNPMYLSYLLVALGFAIYSENWIGFIGPVLYFLYLNFSIIPGEETRLKNGFSSSYEVYAGRVRRWL